MNFLVRIASKPPCFAGNDPVNPSNCSEDCLVLFVRCFALCAPFLAPGKNMIIKGTSKIALTKARLLMHDFRAGKKPINKQTHKQNFHGTVPGLSRPFPEISWEFCLCVSLFPHEKGKTHKQFDPHPFPGQSREVAYVYCFFLPRDLPVHESFWMPLSAGNSLINLVRRRLLN